jgi:hypothetical protein
MLMSLAVLATLKHGILKNVRHVSVSNSCGWSSSNNSARTQELVDYLDGFTDAGDFVDIPGIGKKEIGLFMFDD